MRHGSKQRILKHDPDMPCILSLLAFDKNLPSRAQAIRNYLRERGLAAAGRPDHDKEFTCIDVDNQRTQRRHVARATDRFSIRRRVEFPACGVRSDTQARCAPVV